MGAFDDNPTVFADDSGINRTVKDDIPPTAYAGEMNSNSEAVKPSNDVFDRMTLFADDSGIVKPRKESNDSFVQSADVGNVQENANNANDVFSRMTLFAEDQSETLSSDFINNDRPAETIQNTEPVAQKVVEVANNAEQTVMADQPVINTNYTVAADVVRNVEQTVMADQPVINTNYTVAADVAANNAEQTVMAEPPVINNNYTEVAEVVRNTEQTVMAEPPVINNNYTEVAEVVRNTEQTVMAEVPFNTVSAVSNAEPSHINNAVPTDNASNKGGNGKKAIIAIVAALVAIALIGVAVFLVLGNGRNNSNGDDTELVADTGEDSGDDKGAEDEDPEAVEDETTVKQNADDTADENDDGQKEEPSKPDYDLGDLQDAIGDDVSLGITDSDTGEVVEVAPTKTLEDYLNDGWEIISKVPDIIEAGEVISVILGNGDGKEIITEIVNPLKDPISTEDGIVGSTEIEIGDDSVGLNTGSAALDKVTKALEKVDPKMLETGLSLAKINYDVDDDTIKIFTGEDESKYIGINFEDDKIVSVSVSTLDAIVEYFD